MNKLIQLKIHGMDCAEEVAILQAELSHVQGIANLSFSPLEGKMTVEVGDPPASHQTIVEAVNRTGMSAVLWSEAEKDSDASSSIWARTGRTVLTALSGACLVAGFIFHVGKAGVEAALTEDPSIELPLASIILYVTAAISGGWYVFPKAIRSLIRFRPDMNLLMTIAVAGAIAIGEYFEAGTVAFLFAISLALESWSVGRARRAIAALMSLTPDTARIKSPDGAESIVDVIGVQVGSVIVVRPGEKFPLDGKVLTGLTTVNQAPITGESVPVEKAKGSAVFAGTINQDGAVEIETTKPANDTTLARIIEMVGDAQSKRSPSEQWVERFARYYTPLVMAAALLMMLLPPLLVGGSWSAWFYQALVLLVIACPCALVISTPVSVVSALAASARRGVLVKGGAFMEAPARIRAIAMDKTGTLTEGEPQVIGIHPLGGTSENRALEIAAAIESRSEHPLARAIVRAAGERGIKIKAADEFQAIKGKGARALIDDKAVWLGSHRLLEEKGLETESMHRQLEEIERNGSSVVVIGNDNEVFGLISLADRIRPHSRSAIDALRAVGIERIVMLTGDNRGTGEAIGKEAGVDEVRAELLPEDKVTAIEELVSRYTDVAMVGDGVNDAPAMARATLGIAMGAAGTDAALETADIALMGDDLLNLAWLVRHSRRTLRVIHQNIAASLGVKAVFVLLTLVGQASLWAAIAADMGASLVVIFNGLRLLKAESSAPK